MPSVIRIVLHALGPDARSRLAAELDETVERIDAALPVAVATVLQGLIAASTTPAGLADVTRIIRDADPDALSRPLDRSRPLPTARERAAADRVANATGLKLESSARLVALATAMTLAAIAASGAASDEAGARSFLRTQETEAMRLAPAAVPVGLVQPGAAAAAPEPARPNRLWRLALALLAAVVLLLWWLRFG